MKSNNKSVNEAADFIRQHIAFNPIGTGMVLGSGLGALADSIEKKRIIDTAMIPHWPKSTVQGHPGRLVVGELEKVPVIVMQGRVHYYEGYTMSQVTFPVRVLESLGIGNLIVTNAAGGLNPEFCAGDLMLIEDHINFMGTNPLIGYDDPGAPTRFPDMSKPYDPEFIKISMDVARALGILLRKGVLAVTTGPSYETAAEVRMLRLLGGDAVCMSTVPEVIVAVQLGLRVLGLSCITNPATGLSKRPLSHDEVKKVAGRAQEVFIKLISGIVQKIGRRRADP